MRLLKEQELIDYIICPAFYDIKYNKRIPVEESKSMPKLLNIVAKYFYINILNGKVPTTNALKKKWDSVCEQNLDYITPKRNLEGMGFVLKLYQWAASEEIIVADTDTQYNIVIKRNNNAVELTGNIGTILINKKKQFELLITDFSSRLPEQTLIDMKLQYTMANYTFNTVYSKCINGIRIRNIKNAKNFYTYRTQDDFNRLESSILNIAKAIDHKIYYPRENILCSSCTVKDYCKAWC